MLIDKIKLGLPSVIRDVLKLKPKEVPYDELENGTFFEYDGRLYIKYAYGINIDQYGNTKYFDDEMVRPVRVRVEYDYVLLDDNDKEYEV